MRISYEYNGIWVTEEGETTIFSSTQKQHVFFKQQESHLSHQPSCYSSLIDISSIATTTACPSDDDHASAAAFLSLPLSSVRSPKSDFLCFASLKHSSGEILVDYLNSSYKHGREYRPNCN
mmetsp:Transcript_21614/g.38606  ORF Transcript_21614/g.38606 Transcript_21614/m.38606 type:complete len:121 (-) Transcript_21614:2066-2428(-)